MLESGIFKIRSAILRKIKKLKIPLLNIGKTKCLPKIPLISFYCSLKGIKISNWKWIKFDNTNPEVLAYSVGFHQEPAMKQGLRTNGAYANSNPQNVSLTSHMIRAARILVLHINNEILKKVADKCAKLSLKKLLVAKKISTHENSGGVIYEISIEVEPGGGTFEGRILHAANDGNYRLDGGKMSVTGVIERLNRWKSTLVHRGFANFKALLRLFVMSGFN